MSLRRHLERRLPQREALSNSRWLRRFAHLLHEPRLWHFGRRSVARSAGYGFALAFFPIPIHMLLVFPLAWFRRLNLPVVVGALWITNPVTWVPFFYFAYRVGLLLTGEAAPVPKRPGDAVTATVTHAAPHHLVADVILEVRRTRAGDASASPATGVALGMPVVPAVRPSASG